MSIILYRLVPKWIEQAGQHGYDKKIEELKGEISKNKEMLSAVVHSHFTSSEKLIDKKVEASNILWESALKIIDMIPADINLLYQLHTDDEIESPDAFNTMKITPMLDVTSKLHNYDNTIKPIFEITKNLSPAIPYISDTAFKLYLTLQSLIGRIIYMFTYEYSLSEIYSWKRDEVIIGLLRTSLTDSEIEYIKNMKISALQHLIEMIKHKMLHEIRNSLNIMHSTEDTIKYVKEIEQLYKPTNDGIKEQPNIKK